MIFELVKTIGALCAAFGLVGLFLQNMDRWKAHGLLAAAQFCFGLLQTADGSYGWGALGAGMAACFGYQWWQGGGQRQVQRLRQQFARKGGA